jgi:hypothetical protein
MSTEVRTQSNEVVAVRFFGGQFRGRVVQFTFPASEWKRVRNQWVQEDTWGDGDVVRFSDWVAAQKPDTVYFTDGPCEIKPYPTVVATR